MGEFRSDSSRCLAGEDDVEPVPLYVDAASSFWREWVVNYDATHQRALGHDAVQNSRAVFDTFQDWANRRYQRLIGSARRLRNQIVRSPARWALGFFAVILLSISLLKGQMIWLAIKARGLRKSPGKAPQESRHALVRAHDPVDGQARMEEEPVRYAIKVSPTDRRSRATKQVQAFTEAYEHGPVWRVGKRRRVFAGTLRSD